MINYYLSLRRRKKQNGFEKTLNKDVDIENVEWYYIRVVAFEEVKKTSEKRVDNENEKMLYYKSCWNKTTTKWTLKTEQAKRNQ